MTFFRPELDQKFVDMIENLQKNNSFYFSYSLDLTKSIQRTLQELVKPSESGANSGPEYLRLYPNSINYVHKFAFNH